MSPAVCYVPYRICRTSLYGAGGTAVTVRLEVRLDEKRRAQLEEIAGNRGASISEVVRALIDDAYEEIRRERIRRAVERLINLRGEVMPDPEELSRQLNDKYGPASYNL
jgi:hypothetical protein